MNIAVINNCYCITQWKPHTQYSEATLAFELLLSVLDKVNHKHLTFESLVIALNNTRNTYILFLAQL